MQKLKIIIRILILTISTNTYSQVVFNNNYDIDSLYDGFRTQIELSNGDFIAADQASTLFNEYFGSYISRIDKFGDVIWKKKNRFVYGWSRIN